MLVVLVELILAHFPVRKIDFSVTGAVTVMFTLHMSFSGVQKENRKVNDKSIKMHGYILWFVDE